jgi:hypothetical protein
VSLLPRGPRVWLLSLAVLAPLVWSVALVLRYGVDVPVGDQWWSVASIFARGWNLPSLTELLAQANESRPLFPKLLFMSLASLGGVWDVRREMQATQGLVALVGAGLVFVWHKTIGLRPISIALPLVLVSAWLFAPAQYDNFFWGIQLIVYVPFACLTAVLVAAAAGYGLVPLLAVSGIFAVVATYSYANGMMVWLFSVPVVAWAHWGMHRSRWWAWLVWASAWAASAWAYFHNLSAGAVPSTAAVLRSPIDGLLGLLAYTGSTLSAHTQRLPVVDSKFQMAVAAGSGVVMCLAAAVAYLLRTRRPNGIGPLVIWGTVAAYGLLSGVLTVVGRFSFGPEYMLTSRYVAFSNTILIGAIALATLALRRSWLASAQPARFLVAGAGLLAALGVAGLTALSARHAVLSIEDLYRARLHAQAVLNFFQVATPEELHLLVYWSDTIVLERAPGLLRDGIRRDDGRATTYLPNRPSSPAAGCVEAVVADGPQQSRVSGWSFLQRAGRPADAVLITAANGPGHRPLAIGVPKRSRPDVATLVDSPIGFVTGWVVEAPVAASAVKVWAYDVERNEAYEVPTRCPTSPR